MVVVVVAVVAVVAVAAVAAAVVVVDEEEAIRNTVVVEGIGSTLLHDPLQPSLLDGSLAARTWDPRMLAAINGAMNSSDQRSP